MNLFEALVRRSLPDDVMTRSSSIRHPPTSGIYIPGSTVTTIPGSNIISVRNERLGASRSEEHTSELQSRFDLVCRLLLEKKKQGRDQAVGPPADRCIALRV